MGRIPLVLALLLAVLVAGCIGQEPTQQVQPLSQEPAPAFVRPIQERLAELSDSVFLISSNYTVSASYPMPVYNPFLGNFYADARETITVDVLFSFAGSGFIVSKDGHVLTNAHVVYTNESEVRDLAAYVWGYDVQYYQDQGYSEAQAEELASSFYAYLQEHLVLDSFTNKVFISSRSLPKPLEVEVIKYGTPGGAEDVALLKAPSINIPPLDLGNSDSLSIGERLYVIGYPVDASLGELIVSEEELNPTITSGVVSAVRRTPDGNKIIQTDALVSGGNSGGPALNEKGEVVGIATLGIEYAGFIPSGYNYLVPINYALEFSRPESEYWGLTGQLVDSSDAPVLGVAGIIVVLYFYLNRPTKRKKIR